MLTAPAGHRQGGTYIRAPNATPPTALPSLPEASRCRCICGSPRNGQLEQAPERIQLPQAPWLIGGLCEVNGYWTMMPSALIQMRQICGAGRLGAVALDPTLAIC